MGFLVIGLLLNLYSQHAARGAGWSQQSAIIKAAATSAGSYSGIPIEVDGYDAMGNLANSQILTLNLTTAAPVSCSYFRATPSIIFLPQQTQLTWNCANATACSIATDDGRTILPSPAPKDGGTTFDAPTKNTVYTLTCNNGVMAATVTAQVRVSPPGIREVLP